MKHQLQKEDQQKMLTISDVMNAPIQTILEAYRMVSAIREEWVSIIHFIKFCTRIVFPLIHLKKDSTFITQNLPEVRRNIPHKGTKHQHGHEYQ